MDRIAATGIRFTQAYAHTVCCPSRAALLTGRHPQRGGVINWTQGDRHGRDSQNLNMAAGEVTLAEVLQSAGYRTALFGKWHLGAKTGHGPLDQGFETYFGHLGGFIDNYRHYFLHGQGYHDLYDGNEEIFRREEYYPDLLVERALNYIEANKDTPFFMTVAFNLPHYPEQPIARFKDAYAGLPMPRQSYARVISSVDDHIGRVLDKLEETGLRNNTIVIMMSDNGHSTEDNAGITVGNHASGYPRGYYYLAHGGGGNTGKWIGHKGEFLEGGIRVPAMISYPAKLPQGQTDKQGFAVNIGGCSLGGPPSYFAPYRIPTLEDGKEGEYLPQRLADEAIAFVRKNRDGPFFLSWWPYSVHYPLQARDALIEKYRQRKGIKDPAYAAMIEGMDTAIGRFLKALDEAGLRDNTLLMFKSDNGGYNGDNRPLRGMKGMLYEGGIRIPWIVRWPGQVSPGTTCATPVISTDCYPTLLDAANLPPTPNQPADGKSLMPLLRQSPGFERAAIHFHYPNYAFHKENRLGSAIREGDLKLIKRYDDGSLELYNLTSDIGEKNNLTEKSPELARRLADHLDTWLRETGARMPVREPAR